MKTDHKDVSTERTKQETLLAEEYRKRESRKEKDRRATEAWQKVWSEYAAKKEQQMAEEKKRRPTATQTREEAECAEGETTKMRTKTTSPQKNQAARIQHMSQPKMSSREPTRKATSKLYFVRNVFSLAGQN